MNVAIEQPSARLQPATRRRHWEVLIVSCLVLLLSVLLKPVDGDRIALSALEGYPLPPLCMSRQLFNVDCPGCGLTRSFVQLAHGNIAAAVNHHRVGWVLFTVVVLQIPYRLFALRYRPQPGPMWTTLPHYTAITLIALLLINWIAEALL